MQELFRLQQGLVITIRHYYFGLVWNHTFTGKRVVISITVQIFPANCPLGTSSRLLSLQFSSFLQRVFSHQISSEDFSSYVKDIWNSNEGFVKTYDAPESIRDYIWRLSFDKLITEHGRPEQPLSISQHLFGDENSVSARLVYDPPVTHGRESLEYHTHPVDTIIIVISGSGIYSFIHDDFIQIIDVDLNPGKILFFPANTVHTINQIGLDGLETLNITDVLNQPSYRDEIHNEKRELLPEPSSDFSQEYNDATEEFISYEIYLSHVSSR